MKKPTNNLHTKFMCVGKNDCSETVVLYILPVIKNSKKRKYLPLFFKSRVIQTHQETVAWFTHQIMF